MRVDGGETYTAGIAPSGEPQFELRHSVGASGDVLVMKGELDLVCAPALDAAVRRVCTGQADSLTLDLTGVTFMDSTGLRAILRAEELCAREDCELVLISGSSQVQRLFEVTGLLERLPFRADQQLDSLDAGSSNSSAEGSAENRAFS